MSNVIKCRRKPGILEAIKITNDTFDECIEWLAPDHEYYKYTERDLCTIGIITPTGAVAASEGDYIIKGTAGEFYPCKADIFPNIYEIVECDPPPELKEE